MSEMIPRREPTHEQVQVLLDRAIELSGHDLYNASNDPDVATVQYCALRCHYDCQCNSCRTWRTLSVIILTRAIERMEH